MAKKENPQQKEKRKYERPQILRHSAGYMNKYGRGSLQLPIKDIDGVSLKELVKQFGSPLYIISESTLNRKFREAQRAFSYRYPKVVFAWSYKTNYLKAVCATLHKAGAWAEVVSGLEYEMARSLGIPGDKIIFNGPAKSEESLRRAIKEGAYIHIDHFEELHLLGKLSQNSEKKVPVGIRINLDAGIYPAWDRFGFNLETGQATEAAKRIRTSRSLVLKGFHCHLGTYILDAEAYRRTAYKLLDFADYLKSEFGMTIEWFDFGGGFASHNTLHASYLPGEYLVPSFNDYAACITEPIVFRRKTPEEMPVLILESGRAIVDEAAFLATTVIAAKRLASGKRAFVIDAGVNNLITAFWYKHDIALTDDYTSFMEDSVVYGPLCMIIDCLRESVMLPPLEPGALLLIKNVGAYNMTQWMQFIHCRPAVVMITESGKPQLIREKENLSYLTTPEHLPDHLKNGEHKS